MRKMIESQRTLGTVPMSRISFDIHCRHEIVPILMALQHLYSRPGAMSEICALIRNDIVGDRNEELGCSGMSYWEILVLASARLGCNLDYDALHDLANNHTTLRDIMRISRYDDERFPRATIHDNISKLSRETLTEISDIVVYEAHTLCPPRAIEKVRGDSFVVQKNIHYPTDANLIYDGIRKTIQLTARLAEAYSIVGWRQHAHLLSKIKSVIRKIQKVARSKRKNKEEEIKELYKKLINRVHSIIGRSLDTIFTVGTIQNGSNPFSSLEMDSSISEIFYFLAATQNMCDLARRRVLEDEKIPHSEKVFSFFEPFTELINRGKMPYPIEFGHRVLVIQDSAGFIVHSEVMGIGVTDEKVLVDAMKKLQARFNDKIRAASFDKGFWTPNNLQELSGIVELPCLPKKGKRSKVDQEREGSKEFGKIRKWHPGIESAIHALGSGNGLIVCRDKGDVGYQRYVALAVLGRNLQTLGTILLAKERMRQRKQARAA